MPASAHARGFTLLEVMVALVVTSIGLLGIAKLQALAYASTGSASVRSLVALQAAGLAASMHADRGYWAGGRTGPGHHHRHLDQRCDSERGGRELPAYCVVGSRRTALHRRRDGRLRFAYLCGVAQRDARQFESGHDDHLSECITPVNCTIQVTWTEKAVSINKQSAAEHRRNATFAPTYTLYVEP